MEFSPIKSASSKQVAANIIEKIRKEDPSYWPYGVSVGHHDGGLFLVRSASTKEPVGFTGWQRRNDGLKKVAYYSIGILPEHRSKGYAKEAVEKLRTKLAGQVDEFRAFVMPHNEASIGLAEKLDIPIEFDAPGEKSAHVKAANPLKWLLTPAGRGTTGALAGGGFGAGMYGSADQWRESPMSALTGIGANSLLGAHIARIPAGSRLGFKDLLTSMAVGMGANTVPHMHKLTGEADKTLKQVRYDLKDFGDNMDMATESLRENPVLNKINWAARHHPDKIVAGALGLGAAVPILMAMSNYTHRARTNAITNLSKDLEELQAKAKPDQEIFREQDSEELEKQAGIMSKLSPLLGTLAGAGTGIGMNELVYPEGSQTPSTPLGKGVNLISHLFAGNTVGRSLRKGISPRVANRLRRDAAIAAGGGPLLGAGGVQFRDVINDSSNLFAEEVPNMSQSMANLASPFTGAASFRDYWEKNKSWLMPTAILSHAIPLGVWAHSSYSKDKGIHNMTEHFINNQDRYLATHDPEKQKENEEIVDGVVKEAALGKILSHLGRNSSRYGGAVGAAGNAAVWDAAMYGDNPVKNMTSERALGTLFGLLGGGMAGGSAGRAFSGVNQAGKKLSPTAIKNLTSQAKLSLLLTPAERAFVSGAGYFSEGQRLAKDQRTALANPTAPPATSTSVGDLIKDNPGKSSLIALLGAGGLGYLGTRIAKALEKPQEISIDQQASPGHLKITLPTKDPNDNETQVVLPLDAASTVNLSKSLQDTIGRDARRKLRTGAKERVRRRKSPAEEADDNVIQFDKSATTIDVVAEILDAMPA